MASRSWLGALAIAAAFFVFVIRPARIPRDAILTIRLSGALPEEPHRSIIDQIRGRAFPALTHLRYALEEVRRDPAIRALVIEIAGIDNGLATAEELHDLIRGVRESGKRVIAVFDSDSAGVRDYLVASAADEVICNPDTMIAMLGVSAGGVFLKRALEKLHIQVQTLQYKEYKGAAETFSRESMSAPLRESLEAIVGDWRQVLTERIAQARKLPTEQGRRAGRSRIYERARRTRAPVSSIAKVTPKTFEPNSIPKASARSSSASRGICATRCTRARAASVIASR